MLGGRSVESQGYSLPEVHGSIATSHTRTWKRLLAFAGPAYLVSVGYMDPGNWATDLEGGARFGYRLLWVLVLSNVVALLLQTLSARLGIVAGRDLAQSCRDEYPRPVSYVLWVLSEIAIVACDLAEVLGAAIGLNLLFHLPLLIGVLVTAADTLLILWFTRVGIRVVEAFVLVLIATIAGCFAFEILLAHPAPGEVLTGLVPRLNSSTVYIAVAIFGATVMPHNLYLHSALVQTRRLGSTSDDKRL
ncbi:MAG TPA: Nramp family divalent metal transporter, partial [Bryobacteraceae bacterium]|nr:Nramp family divalent metal transporter [Bryobacteraceae bacterium]